MLWLQVCFVGFTLFSTHIDSARILGVYPTPSISHQVVFRALTLELVKRGHEVVVITPDPVYRGQVPPKNLTEIDLSGAYEQLRKLLFTGDIGSTMKRGVIMDALAIMKKDPNSMVKIGADIFEFQEVKDLIADKNQKFDLVIVEALYYSTLIFSKIYNAPAILFSSFYGTGHNLGTVGAVSRHPEFHPNFYRMKYKDLNFWEKIEELKKEWDFYVYENIYEDVENDFLKSVFGVDSPTVQELKSYVELFFVNSHPIFDGNRPVPPGVVYLGGMHIEAYKALTQDLISYILQDLQSYLDTSTRGVIYVSLGTNVRPSMMDQDMLDSFLDAFEALPYDVMWKFDGDGLKRIPKNVRIQKWFPQRDLLGHPNIKLFITQGGLQSTDEAIDAELPMVGIPFLGDQWFNVNKYIELGIGEGVDALTISADKLVAAALKVIGDDSYKKNIARLRAEMRDQPQSPLERAVWWTEYVLRHGRSQRLLPVYALKPLGDWFMTDLLMQAAAILLLAVLVASVMLYYVISLLGDFNRKVKVKQA